MVSWARSSCPGRVISRGDSPLALSEGDVPPISVDWREAGVLRRVLLRALNENQVLILLHASGSRGRSPTSLLREISAEHRVPLSTLKLNARILRELGLLDYDRG